MAADAPLRKYNLLHPADDPSPQRTPVPSKTLKVDERVVNHLFNLEIIDPHLTPHVRHALNTHSLADLNLSTDLKNYLALIFRDQKSCLQKSVFYSQGPKSAGWQSTAEALCKELGLSLLVVNLESTLDDHRLGFENALRLVRREALLQNAALCWQEFDRLLVQDKRTYLSELLIETQAQLGLTFLLVEKTCEPLDPLPDLFFERIEFHIRIMPNDIFRAYILALQRKSSALVIDRFGMRQS